MSLVKKISLTIFEGEPWQFTGNDGKRRTGFRYKGFDSSDNVIVFNCKEDKFDVHDSGGYDASKAQDFELHGTEYQGKTKWWSGEKGVAVTVEED